jgi:hypothetical protein
VTWAARLAMLVALGACVCGCEVSGGGSVATSGNGSATAHLPSTLPPAAVPYLPSTFRRLTAAGLAREAGAPQLRRQLSSWGFIGGADRYFQGESRQLQVVDSRVLRFRSALGASQFIGFVRHHAATYLGSFPGMRLFRSRGRSGILATAQECQCHLANPAFLAVVTRSGVVTWLEINGPGATSRRLAQLIAAAP